MSIKRYKIKEFLDDIQYDANSMRIKNLSDNDLVEIATGLYDELHILQREERKIFEELTPQGSEFIDEPERVRDYIKEQLDLGHNARKEIVKLRRKLNEQNR